jgi:polysaccharide biosynthesis/export protein
VTLHYNRLFSACSALAMCLALSCAVSAQVIPQAPTTSQAPATPAAPQAAVPGGVDTLRQTYQLAANDQILIHAPDAEELNDRPFRIDDDGTLTLPLVGPVKAAGTTPLQLEQNLTNLLRKFIVNPVISITVVQFRSAPVTFLGEFQKPGIYSLQGRRTLVEMLTTVGGTLPTASRRIKVTRKDESGTIPLPGAVDDPEAKTNSVEISLSSLSEINPAEDIVLEPYDVISVDRAEQVYTAGAFGKVGGFDVGVKDGIPVLELLSLAGGLATDADSANARILRPVLTTNRRAEIPLDLNKIISTEGTDYPLMPGDILYVPHRKPHSAALARLGTVALTMIPGVIVALILNRII